MNLSEKECLIIEMTLRRLKNITELSEDEEKILKKIEKELDYRELLSSFGIDFETKKKMK